MKHVVMTCRLFATMILLTTVSFAEDAIPFEFEQQITVSEISAEELVEVSLDSDVCSATQDGFPDLAVLDSRNTAIPFLIRKQKTKNDKILRRDWKATDLSLQPQGDEVLEVRIRLADKDPQPAGIRLVTPLKNFEQRVQIFAVDSTGETPLVQDAVIFDYSQFMDIRRTEIPLPQTTARQFRVVIDALTPEQMSELLQLTRSLQGDAEQGRTEKTTIQRRAFRIDQIELWNEAAKETQPVDPGHPWPLTGFELSEDEEQHLTVIDVSTGREPLTAFRLKTSSHNFSRRVRVQIPVRNRNDEDWQDVTSATISRFQLRNLQEEKLSFEFSELRNERLRIIIENRDSPALQIDGVEAFGNSYSAAFLASPENDYRLVYKAESVTPAQHDTAAIQAALTQGIHPVIATAGGQTATGHAPEAKGFDVVSLVNDPVVLFSVVVVLVLILGYGLYQASQRIDQTPGEDA